MTNDMDPTSVARIIDHASKQDAQWILIAVVVVLVVALGAGGRWALLLIRQLFEVQITVLRENTTTNAEVRDALRAMKEEFQGHTHVVQEAATNVFEQGKILSRIRESMKE